VRKHHSNLFFDLEMWNGAEMKEPEKHQALVERQLNVPEDLSGQSETDLSGVEYQYTISSPLPGSHVRVRARLPSDDRGWWEDQWYTSSWRAEEEAGRSAHYGVKLDRAREFMTEFIRSQGRGDPAEWFKLYDNGRLDRNARKRK
jgi:hypothetical protein